MEIVINMKFVYHIFESTTLKVEMSILEHSVVFLLYISYRISHSSSSVDE
jgi:hypothetical protein